MNDSISSSNRQLSLLIVGVGNGGCNTVQTIARQWPNGPRIVGVNTDRRALAGLEAIEGIPIGEKVLKGLGTGGEPRIARQAAESDIEKLRSLFDGIELVIFAVGLGGGTGSGVAPLLIDEAKKAGALTLCFVMLPFEFEGPRRKEQAEHGLQAIRDLADGVICLPSQRLTALVKDKANIREAFRKAETMLATGIREFWRVLSHSSVINFDFADLRAFLQNSNGNCIFCCSEGNGAKRIEMVLDSIKRHILFNSCRTLAEADSFAICITGGADLAIREIDAVIKGIVALGRKDALAMTGVGCEPEWQEKINVTILAAEKRLGNANQAPADIEQARQDINPKAYSKEHSEPGQPDLIQTGLFDAVEQGRFKGVSPTIVDGSNLDIPTFIRRRIQIQKAKIVSI
ncbi:MAG: cell division protein FtsZ [Kiritimatiellia bacterium]|nr:cell division protein FtsZ [Kiritimatiellia bacterium]